MVLKPRARIKVNSLLRGTEQTITPEELAILRLGSSNLLEVTDELVSQSIQPTDPAVCSSLDFWRRLTTKASFATSSM